MNKTPGSLPNFDIPVSVTGEFTGNVMPLLHEIRHALDALLERDHVTTIDLRAMSLAPGEEARIEENLGQGELKVELNALGRSDILETRYPGVWLITHHNTEDVVVGKYIQISFIPDILLAQRGDIQAGREQLSSELKPATSD